MVDLFSLLHVHLKSKEVLGSPELELGHSGFLRSLDDDSVALDLVLLLTSHDFDELFQILNFLGLQNVRRSGWDKYLP